MEAGRKTQSKIGIISLILCVIYIILSIFTYDYDTVLLYFVMVTIKIIALIMAVIALRNDNKKKVIPIISVLIASFLVIALGL